MRDLDRQRCLQQFIRGERSLESLEDCLDGVAKLRFWDTDQRDVQLSSRLPEVLFRREDVDAQLQRFLAKGIDGRSLSDWAAAVRLLGCFDVGEEEPGSSEVWDILDELMTPDVWGPITVESILELRRRLNAAPSNPRD